MKLTNEHADIFIPDGVGLEEALSRTTHLCIGAHPDDIELNCYPPIAECYGRNDCWFTGVTVTDGAGCAREGPFAACTDAEMVAVRCEEQRRTAAIGQYSAQFQLGYSSAIAKDPTDRSIIDDLRQILEIAQPQTVYLHNPADKHDTHVAVFLRSLAALRALPIEQRPQKAFAYEGWRNLDWLNDSEKVALDASKHTNLASELAGVFESQIAGGKRYDLAVAGRRQTNATFFDAYQVDATNALTWAMDVTPLVHVENLPVENFVLGFIERFQDDVSLRLKRLSQEPE